jgi:tetratricopeptide (TPR) repeat protein
MGAYRLAQTLFGRLSPDEGVSAIKAAVQRALQCEGPLPEAHALLGYVASFFERDWPAAERHFDHPGAKQAGYALTRPLYGGFLFAKGDFDGAIAVATRAIEEDPLEVWPRMNLHAYFQGAGRDREAYEQAQKAVELDANLVVALVSIAHFHAYWGEWPEAVAAGRRAHAAGSWYPDAVATLAGILVNAGANDEARELCQSLGQGERFGDVRAQALYHLLIGDLETAADWVERGLEERDHSLMYYLRFVIGRPLKASQRWARIARMANME